MKIFERPPAKVLSLVDRLPDEPAVVANEGPAGETADFVDARLAARGTEIRASIAGYLSEIGTALTRGHIRRPARPVERDPEPEDAEPVDVDEDRRAVVTGAVIVLLADGAPLVTWRGEVGWEGLRLASYAVGDIESGRRPMRRHRHWSSNQHVEHRWAERVRYKRKREAEVEAKRAAAPWRCEFCDHGYKRKGNAERHESACWKNPNAERYLSGEYSCTVVDGRVTGFIRRRWPDPVGIA